MKTKTNNRTQEIVLVICCIMFCIFWLLALDNSGKMEDINNCKSIEQNLELINTEATPERLDLERAYFQMGCNDLQ